MSNANSPASSTPETGRPGRSATDQPRPVPSWLVQLDDIEIIAVTGADGERFLQGQLSANMSRLTPTQSLRAALCNLKGRVVADLRVLRHGEQILLICRAGMAEIVVATLKKYIVFFKASLQLVSEQYVALGIAGESCAETLNAVGVQPPAGVDACILSHGGAFIRIEESPARFLCVLDGNQGELAAMLSSRCDSGSARDWRLADIVAGIAHIRPGQQELYTPQVLNYDINGIIDFKKGCYTGQEVVARMYYRAEAKKRLRHVSLDPDQPLPASGDVVDAVELSGGKTEALVIMPVTAQ
jgi:folate-binding protein YgfZ